MNEKENSSTNILNNINNQFKELIDLIEKEKNTSFSIKSFEKKTKSKRKWWILSFLLFLSISIYFLLLNDELSYNIYFLFLSFIRLILIKVSREYRFNRIFSFQDSSILGLDECLYKSMFYHQSIF
jgi:hypothetical protein